MYDVAVIIVNYNTSEYTLKCLDALEQHTTHSVNFQVIVVDNASQNTEYQLLAREFPKKKNYTLHRSDLNTGFGGGNMLGVPYAKASYLLFLNNDAFLLNDALSILKNYMDQHPTVGVSTAQNFDDDHQFVPSFDHNKGFRRLLLGRGFLESTNPKKYPRRKEEYVHPINVDWVNGAFMFFRRDAFEKVGGFDTNIFLYFEEMDICQRLKNAGFTTVLVPAAKILHVQGVSIGKSKEINKEAYLSYLHVIKKNYGYLKYIFIKLYLALVFLLKPKKWYLLITVLWTDFSRSMKYKQTITTYEG
ncbi:MAG: glycosyltransferase family 2 protein [Flavobacteriaceae bacterium]|nr:glycosyltransferase family 2 protein [Flavobacteriaceae bacterium]